MKMFAASATMKNVHLVGAGWLLALFLVFLQLEAPHARSLSPEDDFFSAAVKRNTWWSKRGSSSLDALDSIPRNDLMTESTKCSDTVEIYECYIEKCVQSFVTCARQAGSEEVFSACKMIHKMCASSCTTNNNDAR